MPRRGSVARCGPETSAETQQRICLGREAAGLTSERPGPGQEQLRRPRGRADDRVPGVDRGIPGARCPAPGFRVRGRNRTDAPASKARAPGPARQAFSVPMARYSCTDPVVRGSHEHPLRRMTSHPPQPASASTTTSESAKPPTVRAPTGACGSFPVTARGLGPSAQIPTVRPRLQGKPLARRENHQGALGPPATARELEPQHAGERNRREQRFPHSSGSRSGPFLVPECDGTRRRSSNFICGQDCVQPARPPRHCGRSAEKLGLFQRRRISSPRTQLMETSSTELVRQQDVPERGPPEYPDLQGFNAGMMPPAPASRLPATRMLQRHRGLPVRGPADVMRRAVGGHRRDVVAQEQLLPHQRPQLLGGATCAQGRSQGRLPGITASGGPGHRSPSPPASIRPAKLLRGDLLLVVHRAAGTGPGLRARPHRLRRLATESAPSRCRSPPPRDPVSAAGLGGSGTSVGSKAPEPPRPFPVPCASSSGRTKPVSGSARSTARSTTSAIASFAHADHAATAPRCRVTRSASTMVPGNGPAPTPCVPSDPSRSRVGQRNLLRFAVAGLVHRGRHLVHEPLQVLFFPLGQRPLLFALMASSSRLKTPDRDQPEPPALTPPSRRDVLLTVEDGVPSLKIRKTVRCRHR